MRINPELINYLDNIPGLAFWKNKSLTFIECNHDFAVSAGCEQARDLNGFSDYDMPWAKYAERYRNDDRRSILKSETIARVEPFIDCKGVKQIVRVIKKPILARNNSNKILGVSGCSHILLSSGLVSQQNTSHQTATDIETIRMLFVDMTLRQAQCLYYIIRGYTCKDIASELNIGKRAVEDHCNLLKTRFDAKNKTDLIRKAYDIGFYYVTPEGCL